MSNPDYPNDVYPGDTSTTAVLNPYDPAGGLYGYLPYSYGVQDHDWFKVTLSVGRTYNFHVFGVPGAQYEQLYDPELYLRDANGAQIAFNDDANVFNSDPWIMYTPAASGTYYLDVTGSLVHSSESGGGYLVTALADDNPWDFYDLTNMPSVNVGSPSNGFIDYQGDTDYVQTNLVAHRHYVIQQFGSGAFRLSQSDLILRDAAYNVQAHDNYQTGSGFWSDILYTPSVSGPYILEAGAKNANLGTYTITVQYATVRSDLGDDARSDILFRNSAGVTYLFTMNDAVVSSGATTGVQVGANWQIKGLGDFNGDGKADLLFDYRNAANSSDPLNGVYYISMQNGAATGTGSGVFQQLAQVWQVAAVGDFDGDAKADILFRNSSTGQLFLDVMSGTTASFYSGPTYQQIADPHWQVAAVGDLNGDGTADLVWRYDNSSNAADPLNGALYAWTMSGRGATSQALLSSQPGSDHWTVAGTGDFDGNGTADILLRYNNAANASDPRNGLAYIDFMNGATVTSGAPTQWQIDNSWTIASIGDYNGDGMADILFQRKTDGATYIWDMNGSSVSSGKFTTVQSGAGWTVQNGALIG